MTWEPELDELRRRTEMAKAMGGPDKVARQHEFGKLTIRERVDRLVDAGSFDEIGTVAGVGAYDEHGELIAFTPSNFVFGAAAVDGRPVIVSGDDFTVRGGSADASIGAKRNHAEGLALELRVPHVRLVDGMGGGGSVKTIEQLGRTPISQMRGWDVVLSHLSVAPSVSLALGSVAGIGAARVATSHYSVIVKDTAQMMIAGPALVDFAMPGPHHDKNELGGSHVHVTNGAIDDEAESEEEAFALARRFLSYLPTSVDELPRAAPCTDDPERREEMLVSIVPRNPRHVYKMRAIIEAIADREGDGHVVLRDRTPVGEVDHLWSRSLQRVADRALRGRPLHLRRRVDGVVVAEGHAAHRPRVHIPPAARAPRRLPGVPHRPPGRAGRHDPPRLSRARRAGREPVAVLLDRDPQGVRSRGRGELAAGQLPLPLRLAVGRLGFAARRGRHRGRVQGRAGRRP